MSKVELQSKTSKARRNSWAEIYNETTALRKHKMLLGQEVETDDGLEWRVKWGQRGVGLFGVAAVVSHFAQETIALIVFAAAVFTFLGTVYYKMSPSLLRNDCYGRRTWLLLSFWLCVIYVLMFKII